MPTPDPNFHTGHRERLRQKFLDGKITDYELLESLLGYAIPRRDVRPLARGLIEKFGGVAQVFAADINALIAYPGIGRSAATFLKMIYRAIFIQYEDALVRHTIFHNPQILHNYCRIQLMAKQTEELHILYLDANMRMLLDETHSTGSNSTSFVLPPKIAQTALNLGARSIVLLHNHPNQNNAFSQEDVDVTTELQQTLTPLDIEIHDHFLVAGTCIVSMREKLFFPFAVKKG